MLAKGNYIKPFLLMAYFLNLIAAGDGSLPDY